MPPEKSKPSPTSRSKTKYTEATLQKALKDVKEKKISLRKAMQLYNIPRSTLNYKLSGAHTKDVGRPATFSKEEENIFEAHILALCNAGVPMTMVNVRLILKEYLDSSGRNIKEFDKNMPGFKWGKLFLKRHPALQHKFGRKVAKERALTNRDGVYLFFDNLQEELRGIPPENIYNIDEVCFHDVPINGQLLFHRNNSHPETPRVPSPTNSSFTVMFSGNAAGDLLPPYFVFRCKDEMSDWLAGAPQGSRMNVTKSGWIDVTTFEDFFGNHLLPFLLRTTGKKVIIGDSLSIHISIKTLNICVRNNIFFVTLPPNMKHVLQPLVVGFYSVLKEQWRRVLENWRQAENNKNISLPCELFAQLLTSVLNVINISEENISKSIISGFRTTGIYPLSCLSKLPKHAETVCVQDEFGESLRNYAKELLEANLAILQKEKNKQPLVPAKKVEAVCNHSCPLHCAAGPCDNRNPPDKILPDNNVGSEAQVDKKLTMRTGKYTYHIRRPKLKKKQAEEEETECSDQVPQPVLHLPENSNHDPQAVNGTGEELPNEINMVNEHLSLTPAEIASQSITQTLGLIPVESGSQAIQLTPVEVDPQSGGDGCYQIMEVYFE